MEIIVLSVKIDLAKLWEIAKLSMGFLIIGINRHRILMQSNKEKWRNLGADH